MCLLVLFHKTIPRYPLVLCANRDEFFDRPSSPPLVWEPREGGCSFLAPRDERAKGTWIGFNARSGIAAVTNRIAVPVKGTAPSRGVLLARVLARGGAEAMARAGLEGAYKEEHNGFNLLAADPERAYLLVGEERGVRFKKLDPGVHVLTNEHDLNEVSIPSRDAWRAEPDSLEQLLEALRGLLAMHDPLSRDGFAPCKHKADRGTRSATVIVQGEEGVRFLFADGPPCRTPFEDYSPEAEQVLKSLGGA